MSAADTSSPPPSCWCLTPFGALSPESLLLHLYKNRKYRNNILYFLAKICWIHLWIVFSGGRVFASLNFATSHKNCQITNSNVGQVKGWSRFKKLFCFQTSGLTGENNTFSLPLAETPWLHRGTISDTYTWAKLQSSMSEWLLAAVQQVNL